jgi:hypothetical protein
VLGKPLPTWTYVPAHPTVCCVISATGKPTHLVDNMGAGIGSLPHAKIRRRMTAVADGL